MSDSWIVLIMVIIVVLFFGTFFYTAHLADARDCRHFAVDSGLPTEHRNGACWVTIQPGLDVRSYDFEKYFRFVEE